MTAIVTVKTVDVVAMVAMMMSQWKRRRRERRGRFCVSYLTQRCSYYGCDHHRLWHRQNG